MHRDISAEGDEAGIKGTSAKGQERRTVRSRHPKTHAN